MPAADTWIAFLAATAIFAYMPGPAMLYAAAQTIARGARAGWMAVLGLHIGGYVHVIAAALGLAILFEAVPPLYTAIKLLGAAYLIVLGISLWRADDQASDAKPTPLPTRMQPAFWHSVSVEVLNPKTAIFFLAFLPQFTDPAAAWPLWVQLLVLGTIVNLMFSRADVLCVLAAGKITTTLRQNQGMQTGLRRTGGTILIALGAHLATTRP